MAEINITNAKTDWVAPMIYGILMVVIGICMIVFKKDALKWILIITGILMVIGAVINVAYSIKLGGVIPVMPIVSGVIGVVLIILPNIMADVLMAILGVLLIIYGVLNVLGSVAQRDGGPLVMIIGIAIGVLAAAAGIYALFNLDSTADVVMIVVGVLTIILGVIQVVGAVNLYRQFH